MTQINHGPIMPYGVAINDAIRKGDRTQMESLLAEARKLHEQQGDLGKAIRDLEAALQKHKY